MHRQAGVKVGDMVLAINQDVTLESNYDEVSMLLFQLDLIGPTNIFSGNGTAEACRGRRDHDSAHTQERGVHTFRARGGGEEERG